MTDKIAYVPNPVGATAGIGRGRCVRNSYYKECQQDRVECGKVQHFKGGRGPRSPDADADFSQRAQVDP
jgi:hypothetical protein